MMFVSVEPVPEEFGSEVAEFLGHTPDELFEWPDCALCRSSERDTVVVEEFAKAPLQIVRCADCGFCYSWPRPTHLFASIFHTPQKRNAMVDAGILPEGRRMHGDAIFDYEKQKSMDPQYRQGLREIAEYVPVGTVLDVGCAGGRFVELAAEAGYDAFGIDMQQAPVREGREQRGLNLRTCPPNEIPAELPALNVVTLWNVLEHVSQPIKLLSAIEQALDSGGIVLVDVPNFAFRLLQWRLKGITRPDHQRFMPQEHINHFTQATLSRVLEAAGLRPVAFSVAHSDGSTSTPTRIRRGIMRATFRLSGGRLNWQHPLSCIAQKR
jgi:2-polyprenyl-3-methyl-5-hydroxy-6-metoxy-1,4-benzoquinol methylase